MAAAGVVVFSTHKQYASSAGLWVDNGPATSSSLASTSAASASSADGAPSLSGTPSTFEQGILNELLATDSFDRSVALGSLPKGSVSGPTGRAEEEAISKAVASGTSSATPGAQVLLITSTGSSPQLAQATLGSIITQLQASTARYGQEYGETATRYEQTQLTAAKKTLAAARGALSSYERSHPKSNSFNDTTYAQLSGTLGTASTQVYNDTQALSQAQAEAKVGVQGATVHVLDAPSLSTTPTKSKAKQLMLVVGAGVGGALLVLLMIIALTKTDEDPFGPRGSMSPFDGITGPPPAAQFNFGQARQGVEADAFSEEVDQELVHIDTPRGRITAGNHRGRREPV